MKDKKAFRREHKNNINYLRKVKKIPSMKRWDKEKIYKFSIRYYDSEDIGENGALYSTCNPEARWDWYTIGGRWKDMLLLEDGIKTDSALVKDIKWELMEGFNTYAVIMPDGEWIEAGRLGWWGISYATEEKLKEFKEKFKENILDKVDREWKLTIVDCHF